MSEQEPMEEASKWSKICVKQIIQWFVEKWYYIEIFFWKTIVALGGTRDTDGIPDNTIYCYKWDEERNKNEPTNGYWIKPCKHYRSFNGQIKAGCTYVGFVGDDPLLGDQCKICGEKEENT